VAIDGSEEARKALRLAAQIARRFEAKLTIAHAIPKYDSEGEIEPILEFGRMYEERARTMLQETRASVDLPGDQTEELLLHGPPAETIAQAAEHPDVGMVVIGSRGLGAVARVLLGSVSDRLTHICSKPVLIAR
jgi:nucleotide-binding universal stress UspA family protein